MQREANGEAGPLAGRVAIVTGAAKGLGRAISGRLAGEGAHLVLAGRDLTALKDHARLLDDKFPHRHSLPVRCDVSRETDVDAMVGAAAHRFGRIDILVNAAGIIGPIETPAERVTAEQFREVIDVNVVGTFLPCRAAIPHLIRSDGGRIVNIAGTSGLRGYRNRVAYSSSKWAVRGLTRTLALELGPYGVTVNTVCPNVTHGRRMDTIVREKARVRGVDPQVVYEEFTRQTALGRFIEEDDVAAAVSFLVSDGARNITGHDIVVDAGWDV
jgi:NAD(P)-dependent dehydrogenase (short-subunit alcohol dehydrogenase family)